ncbi:hypothetical protein GYMLUDRAFT_132411, partial [Collybiopsis luxurians FD-317 M1]
MTTYKAQGQTMTNVIADLKLCHGTEVAYVMLSCVKSLDGLLILRLFDLKRIQCRQSGDSRCENKHLEFLQMQT